MTTLTGLISVAYWGLAAFFALGSLLEPDAVNGAVGIGVVAVLMTAVYLANRASERRGKRETRVPRGWRGNDDH